MIAEECMIGDQREVAGIAEFDNRLFGNRTHKETVHSVVEDVGGDHRLLGEDGHQGQLIEVVYEGVNVELMNSRCGGLQEGLDVLSTLLTHGLGRRRLEGFWKA